MRFIELMAAAIVGGLVVVTVHDTKGLLVDDKERGRIIGGWDDKGTTLGLNYADGVPGMSIHSDKTGSCVMLRDQNGRPRLAIMATTLDGGALTFMDANGKIVKALTAGTGSK